MDLRLFPAHTNNRLAPDLERSCHFMHRVIAKVSTGGRESYGMPFVSVIVQHDRVSCESVLVVCRFVSYLPAYEMCVTACFVTRVCLYVSMDVCIYVSRTLDRKSSAETDVSTRITRFTRSRRQNVLYSLTLTPPNIP